MHTHHGPGEGRATTTHDLGQLALRVANVLLACEVDTLSARPYLGCVRTDGREKLGF
jgi:hypothetical protein